MFIYALCEPNGGRVRYIGKAVHVERRYRAHLSDRTDTRRGRWIRSLLQGNEAPVLVILEEIDGDWQEVERRWIAEFRSAGVDLTNHTDGGEGLSNPSEDTREKLRKLRIADWQDTAKREVLLARIQDPARRAKISAALRGKRKSPEHVAKLPQNQAGRKLTDEHRLRISESIRGNQYHKGKPHTEATKVLIANRLRGNQHTKGRVMPTEERLQRSAAQKGRAKSAEHRERIRQAALRRWARWRQKNEVPAKSRNPPDSPK